MAFSPVLKPFAIITTVVCVLGSPAAGQADEGMWTYNNFPVKQLERKYGFSPSTEWLEHLMKSTVRLSSGGSGSFVSPEGLVLTNHHVAADAIAKLSSEANDYMTHGFHASQRDQELRAKDLELNVLQRIEDVTTTVQSAVKPGMTNEEQAEARRAQIEKLENAASDKSGLRANVVILYQGGQYHLYYYKRYTDVRLVFAPEKAAAFFGGDDDNFEYPRYCLDMAFFRAYEDGQPARTEHFLKWSEDGAKEGELTFVAGNPGRTSRLHTLAHLTYHRDVTVPYLLEYLQGLEKSLAEFSAKSSEHARRAEKDYFSVQNSRKLFVGRDAGLQEGRIFHAKERQEGELQEKVQEHPELEDTLSAWDTVREAREVSRQIALAHSLIEYRNGFAGELFSLARTLVRLAEEDKKPSPERLPEYQDARREELLLSLNSTAPIYTNLEQWKLAQSLDFLQRKLGNEHPVVKTALEGKSAEERARELVRGTGLGDASIRAEIMKGGSAAIDESTDTMIVLAKAVDEESRALRKRMETDVDEPEKQAYKLISSAIFTLFGSDQYPDATFSPRIAYGTVKGYDDDDGTSVPAMTKLGGIFAREQAHEAKPPWRLPRRWHEARSTANVKWDVPFNFVSTADIIGGNSGSPVVNTEGELVGLIFDSNIHGLVWDYSYDDTRGRAVSVASGGMLEALKSIYRAHDLVEELTAVGSSQSPEPVVELVN